MAQPPLPVPFPDGSWLIRDLAGVERHPELGEAQLVLVIAPLRNPRAKDTRTIWTLPAVDLTRQQLFRVPITFWRYAVPGSIGNGHHVRSPQVSKGHVFSVTLDVPAVPEYITGEQRTPAGGYAIDLKTHPYGNAYRWMRRAYYVRRPLEGRNDFIIPTFEIIRFYDALVSTPITRGIVEGEPEEVNFAKAEAFAPYLDIDHSGLDSKGVFHAALRPGLQRSDAFYLGRLWIDPAARRHVANIVAGFTADQGAQGVPLTTRTSFPFVGTTHLQVHGVRYPNGHGGTTLLVYRIVSCDHPFGMTALDLVTQDTVEAAPPIPEESSDIRRPGPPNVTSTVEDAPGSKLRPAVFKDDEVRFDRAFPAVKNVPVSVTRGVARTGGARPPQPGKPRDVIGGFGDGQSGGKEVRVDVGPDEGDKERKCMFKGPNVAVGHRFEVWHRAMDLLRGGGVVVTPRCATRPDGAMDLADPNIRLPDDAWQQVYDAGEDVRRPRRAILCELARKCEDGSVEYGYAVELETLGSPILYLEGYRKSQLDETLTLSQVKKLCVENAGRWSRREGDHYESRVALPGVIPSTLHHRWDPTPQRPLTIEQQAKALAEALMRLLERRQASQTVVI